MFKYLLIIISLFIITFQGSGYGSNVPSFKILDIHSAPEGKAQIVVSVVDQQGRPIKGLSKSNFAMEVDGNEVKGFSTEPISSAQNPLSIILGIDISGSMKGSPITEAKKAASIFLDQLEKEDFFAVMVFGNNVKFLSDFNQNKQEARDKLELMKANEMWTWLYQATYEALDKGSKAPTSRVAIVLLTDGKDEGSPRKEEDIIDKVRGVRIPIYTIGFGKNAQVDYLQRIASQSDGYFLFTPRDDDLSRLYNIILNQLKNQYLLKVNFPKQAGDYTVTLTLNYRGEKVTVQRKFLHENIVAESNPPQINIMKNMLIWLIMLVIIVLSVVAIVIVLRKHKQAPASPERAKNDAQVRIMINKKMNPIGISQGEFDFATTIIQPLPAKGEVGLEVDIHPLPIPFSLVDKKHNKELDEVIITRYDDKIEKLFSHEKIYLLLSDKSISRPDKERDGHARVFKDSETKSYRIEDLGSSSGTKVNDVIIEKGKALTLETGDKISIGGSTLEYYDTRIFDETAF